QHPHGEELVDLGLQFQFQAAHRPLVGRVEQQVDEVADAFERRAELLQVGRVEAGVGIAGGEAVDQFSGEVQGDQELATGLGEQQALRRVASAPLATDGVEKGPVGDEIVLDAVLQRNVVQRLQLPL